LKDKNNKKKISISNILEIKPKENIYKDKKKIKNKKNHILL
jgi:hypothetical protein